MKLFIPIIVITSFMISCADILIEDTSNTTSTSGIVGFGLIANLIMVIPIVGFLMTMVINLLMMAVSIP